MMNTMESDLLDVGQDIMEAGADEGGSSIDSIHARIHRQLKGFQLHRQGWRSQKQKNYQDKSSANQNKGVSRIHITHHHGIGLG